jgi:hypothetical protein
MHHVPSLTRVTLGLCQGLALALAVLGWASLLPAQDSQWVRPAKAGDPLVWGRRDGIVFGLDSTGGIKGPRGLIRVGIFAAGLQGPQLLNYIAVEPIVRGVGDRYDRMGFSELEMSTMDPGQRGKRMWVAGVSPEEKDPSAGTMETLHVGDATIERLSVRINVERFTANGAHVYLIASIESDHPGELRLSTYAEDDSPPIEELTVTATMGNFERLRLLWLKNQVEDSRKLFGTYNGEDFIEGESYPLTEMLRSGQGDAIVFATSSEQNPKDSPGNKTAHWVYPLPKMTQYWRVPGYDVQPDLRVRVNARRVYWASTAPVLGGIAFENFEVRQRYIRGQSFIFGLTPLEPWQAYHGLSHLSPQ